MLSTTVASLCHTLLARRWDIITINFSGTAHAQFAKGLTLGAHAQRGRASSRTTGYEAANEWHQRVVNNEKMGMYVAIFLKRLCSRDMA